MKQVIKSLNDKIRSEIFSLNNGGCGQFVYHTAIQLERLKIPYKIICARSRWNSINRKIFISQNKAFEKDPKTVDYYTVIPNHYFIYLKNEKIYFDGYHCAKTRKELWRDSQYFTYPGTLEFLEASLDKGDWNNSYNRNQNPLLKKIINTEFKKYDSPKAKMQKTTLSSLLRRIIKK